MTKGPELTVCASCLEGLGSRSFFMVTGMPGRYCSVECAESAADSARDLLWGHGEEAD